MRTVFWLMVGGLLLWSGRDSFAFEVYTAMSYQNAHSRMYFGSSETIVGRENFMLSTLVFREGDFTLGMLPVSYRTSYNLNIANSFETDKKLILLSRLNELNLQFDLLSGFFFDIGKSRVKTGYSQFRSPTDYFSALRDISDIRSARLYEKTREGFWSASLQYIGSGFSVNNLFSPRLTWDANLYPWAEYFSSQQERMRNLFSISFRVFDVDIEMHSYYENDMVNPDSSHLRFGKYVATVVFDALKLYGETSISERHSQWIATDTNLLLVEPSNFMWYPETTLGAVLTIDNTVSLMAEYHYNGMGLTGDQHTNMINYTSNLYHLTRSISAFDLFLADGMFSLSRHYLMGRFHKSFERDGLSFEVINVNSLTDGSGYLRMGIAFQQNYYNLHAHIASFYGSRESEMGILPEYWRVGVEMEIFGIRLGGGG